jgi:hypothetical protein
MDENKFELRDGTLFVESIDCGYHNFGGKVERIEFSPDLNTFPKTETMIRPGGGYGWYAYANKEVEAWHGPFEGLRDLTEVVIPDHIIRLGIRSFTDCYNLKKVIFSKNLKSIGKRAFGGCTQLEEIVLPKCIERIEDFAFAGCSKLEEIVLPEGIVSVGASAFAGCTNLKSIVIPETVQSICWSSFQNCPVRNEEFYNRFVNFFVEEFRNTRRGGKLSYASGIAPFVNTFDKNHLSKYVARNWSTIFLYKLKKASDDESRRDVIDNMVDSWHLLQALKFDYNTSILDYWLRYRYTESWKKLDYGNFALNRIKELIQSNPERLISEFNYENMLDWAQKSKNPSLISLVLQAGQRFIETRKNEYELRISLDNKR